MSAGEDSPAALGWELDVDAAAGELTLHHPESGGTYVFDAEGGVRIPGDSDVESDLATLREALTSALRESGTDREAVTDGGQSTSGCTIECDDATNEVTIESDSKISLSAPAIDLSADTATLATSGVLTLQGALIELN
jgi:hypothetical protein